MSYNQQRGGGGYNRNQGGNNYQDNYHGGNQQNYQDDNGSQYGGSNYSSHSGGGSQRGGDDRSRHQGSNQNNLSHQMGNMNMGGNRQGMYSQNPNSRFPTNTENNLAGSAQNPRAPIPRQQLAHATQTFAERPKEFVFDKKAVGKKTQLWTNHALVHLPEQTIKLYAYNIEITQNRKVVNKREQAGPIFWEIMRANRTHYPGYKYFVFNDVNMMWSYDQLQRAEGDIILKKDKGGNPTTYLNYKYTGRLDFGKTIREDQDRQLLSTLVDSIATARVRTDCRKFIVFKRCVFALNKDEDNTLTHELTNKFYHGIDSRLGISVAIRLNLRAGITACYDIQHSIFTRSGYPLIRLLCEIINLDVITNDEFENEWDEKLQNAQMTESNRKEMDSILKKLRLRYTLETGIKVSDNGEENVPSVLMVNDRGKEFTYYKLTETSARDTIFTDQNGVDRTVAQYFLDAHHIRLRYPNLPCLQKKSSKKNPAFIAFPMEFVSYSVNPARFEGHMSEKLKMSFIQQTSYSMEQRRAILNKIIGQEDIADCPPVVDNTDKYMEKYNLSIEKEMLSVNATVLPVPTLVYGEGSKFTDTKHHGVWDALINDPPRKVLENSIFIRNPDPNAPKKKKRLLGSILNIISPHNNYNTLDWDKIYYHRLMGALELAGQPVAWEGQGMAAIQGLTHFHQRQSPEALIPDFFLELKRTANHEDNNKYKESEDEELIPFVLVVFQVRCSALKLNDGLNNDYNFMKYWGDNAAGIYTQGILTTSLSSINENPIYCKLTHLMVEKILGKIGTTHRKIERGGDHRSWTKLTDRENPCLVLGVDVSHPSTQDRLTNDIRRLSIATVVGNIDIDCCEFRASSRIQDMGNETIVSFQFEVNKRINEFIANNNGKRPAHIIMYRDGIAESDFKRTLYEERINIENACLEIDPAYQPTITYIVATKRHHTRFFLKNPEEGHEFQNYNILPGTLVEDTVTTNEYYDFFLTTQVGQTGLARPTHYYVLHDTWKPMVSFWPTITHAFTYMFCRSTSTVSLPAPLLYAHLAAKRAKECLDGAWITAPLQNMSFDLKQYKDVCMLTSAINVNHGLDGMTFV
uniref:Piwi domain-containing protein n=1 Tax=Caenorhabditis tropicalis TaxID=1561998 RepID=A0A1I7TYL6_9PELO